MQLITLNNKHTCMSKQDFHSANSECKQLILKFVVVLDPFFPCVIKAPTQYSLPIKPGLPNRTKNK
jgi:hypothetical protein